MSYIISRYWILTGYLTLVVFLSMSAARADEGPVHDQQHDLAKQSQNPIISLVSVPFEFNNNFNTGPEDAYFQQILSQQGEMMGMPLYQRRTVFRALQKADPDGGYCTVCSICSGLSSRECSVSC